jgi:hypothetical protein
MRLTKHFYCISTRLAILWAGLGIPFTIIASFGQNHLIHLD